MRTAMRKKLFTLTFYSLPLIAFFFHGTDPRAQIVFPRSTQRLLLPAKVAIRKDHGAQGSSFSRVPADLRIAQGDRPSAPEVKAYVRTQAVEHGVDPRLALWIVKHESSFNPRAKGDGEASRGLWQISRIYHPEVSDARAFNVATSTEWSLERIRSGKVNEWSSYRNCRSLYEDCPY
jgi:hypothetical protein